MAMKYALLTEDEQDEIVAAFLHAQERDHFCYTINAERYRQLSGTLPAGPFKDRIEALLVTEEAELAKCEAIITETTKQLPDQARLDAAASRVKAKSG